MLLRRFSACFARFFACGEFATITNLYEILRGRIIVTLAVGVNCCLQLLPKITEMIPRADIGLKIKRATLQNCVL